MTKEQAVALAETQWWKDRPLLFVASFQLNEPLLCMDFADFHEAVEKSVGHPVFTHEFAWPDHLKAELKQYMPIPPVFHDVLQLLPASEREHILKGEPTT